MGYYEDRTLTREIRWRKMYNKMTEEAGGIPLPQRFVLYNDFLVMLWYLLNRSKTDLTVIPLVNLRSDFRTGLQVSIRTHSRRSVATLLSWERNEGFVSGRTELSFFFFFCFFLTAGWLTFIPLRSPIATASRLHQSCRNSIFFGYCHRSSLYRPPVWFTWFGANYRGSGCALGRTNILAPISLSDCTQTCKTVSTTLPKKKKSECNRSWRIKCNRSIACGPFFRRDQLAIPPEPRVLFRRWVFSYEAFIHRIPYIWTFGYVYFGVGESNCRIWCCVLRLAEFWNWCSDSLDPGLLTTKRRPWWLTSTRSTKLLTYLSAVFRAKQPGSRPTAFTSFVLDAKAARCSLNAGAGLNNVANCGQRFISSHGRVGCRCYDHSTMCEMSLANQWYTFRDGALLLYFCCPKGSQQVNRPDCSNRVSVTTREASLPSVCTVKV